MFDEAPPSTSAPSSTANSSETAVSSGPIAGQRATRGRVRMPKAKAGNKAATANSSVTNGHNKNTVEPTVEAAIDSLDLEDGLEADPKALVQKVRRKSGLSHFDVELMRIVGQHLADIGLKHSAEVLMAESGTQLTHPIAAKFKKHVLQGEWSKALKSIF